MESLAQKKLLDLVKVKILLKKEEMEPAYQTVQSSGMDLRAFLDVPVAIAPRERKVIPTGVSIALPEGLEGQIRPRSSLALKYGVTVLNSPGTIDADYRGELKVLLINHGESSFTVEPADRIAQLVIAPYTKISWESTNLLDRTARGKGGYGSTGIK